MTNVISQFTLYNFVEKGYQLLLINWFILLRLSNIIDQWVYTPLREQQYILHTHIRTPLYSTIYSTSSALTEDQWVKDRAVDV